MDGRSRGACKRPRSSLLMVYYGVMEILCGCVSLGPKGFQRFSYLWIQSGKSVQIPKL